MHSPSYPPYCPPQTPAPNLMVAHLQAIAPRYRPWMAMFEAVWSVEKIAETWNDTPEHVAAILDDLSQQPPRPLSPGAQRLLAAERSPVVTIGQFRTMAKERGWSEAWLVEQCKDHMDNPGAIVREMLAGDGTTKPAFTGYDKPAHRVNLTDTVLVWWPLLNLYHARHSTCACGCQKPLQASNGMRALPVGRGCQGSVTALIRPTNPHKY
jgi:hypothetical protein